MSTATRSAASAPAAACAAGGLPRAAARGGCSIGRGDQRPLLAGGRAEAVDGQRQDERRRGQQGEPWRERQAHATGVGERLAEGHRDLPAAAVDQPRPERRRRAGCARAARGGRAGGRSALRGRARAPARSPTPGSSSASHSGISAARRARRIVLAAGEPVRHRRRAAPKRSASVARENAASWPSVAIPSRSSVVTSGAVTARATRSSATGAAARGGRGRSPRTNAVRRGRVASPPPARRSGSVRRPGGPARRSPAWPPRATSSSLPP